MRCKKCGHDAAEHCVVTVDDDVHHPLMHCTHKTMVTRTRSVRDLPLTVDEKRLELCRCETGNRQMVPYAIPYDKWFQVSE